ncbi:MAG: hypothetical protein PHG47_05455 [Sulfuricella sp.]|nr:hypothetical protein [Sulfuricella sp.]
MAKARLTRLKNAGTTALKPLIDLQEREKHRLLGEIVQIRGLMPLLMKPRNNQPWSQADREEILRYMRQLSTLSPYLILLVLPGSFILLPLLAWWLDRRRTLRPPNDKPASTRETPKS